MLHDDIAYKATRWKHPELLKPSRKELEKKSNCKVIEHYLFFVQKTTHLYQYSELNAQNYYMFVYVFLCSYVQNMLEKKSSSFSKIS